MFSIRGIQCAADFESVRLLIGVVDKQGHRPTDTLATLDLEFAAKVARATTGVVLEMARLAE